jgi:hypothetical protein
VDNIAGLLLAEGVRFGVPSSVLLARKVLTLRKDIRVPMSLEQIRAFLAGSGEVRFAGQRREEVYGWVEQTVVRHQYAGWTGRGRVWCGVTSPG